MYECLDLIPLSQNKEQLPVFVKKAINPEMGSFYDQLCNYSLHKRTLIYGVNLLKLSYLIDNPYLLNTFPPHIAYFKCDLLWSGLALCYHFNC
jgi:hypothetical protein